MGSDRIEELLLQLIQDMAEVKAKLNNIDEQKLSNRTRIDEFTIEHVNPDSQGEENARIGNLIPLEKGLNERCDNKTIQEKIEVYDDSNYATARKLAKRIENADGVFDSKKRSLYLGKMIYDDIVNYLNEENLKVK